MLKFAKTFQTSSTTKVQTKMRRKKMTKRKKKTWMKKKNKLAKERLPKRKRRARRKRRTRKRVKMPPRNLVKKNTVERIEFDQVLLSIFNLYPYTLQAHRVIVMIVLARNWIRRSQVLKSNRMYLFINYLITIFNQY